MSSNMEQIIEEIEDYIDGCKYQPLSNTKIVVNKDEIQELIAELRHKTPDEIKRYQRIISNKEAIMADAQQKADTIISKAKMQKDELVREHEIMQQAISQANEVVLAAQKQAQDMLDAATNDANEIRMGAIAYADSMLQAIEQLLSGSQNIFKTNFAQLNASLQNTLDVVSANRAELMPSEVMPQPDQGPAAAPEEAGSSGGQQPENKSAEQEQAPAQQ